MNQKQEQFIVTVGHQCPLSINPPIEDPNKVVFETSECLRIAQRLNEFENSIFGLDFWCPLERVSHWITSGDLLYSAVVTPKTSKSWSVLSVASILLVDIESINSLIHGHICESELVPFSLAGGGAKPAFYFSSLVVSHPMHAAALFRSLESDFLATFANRRLVCDLAFSIPTGAEATQHLVRSGFEPIPGHLYLNKYEIFMLHKSTARSRFWQRMFSTKKPGRYSVQSQTNFVDF